MLRPVDAQCASALGLDLRSLIARILKRLAPEHVFDAALRPSYRIFPNVTDAATVTFGALDRPPPTLRDGRKDRVFDTAVFHAKLRSAGQGDPLWRQTMTPVCSKRRANRLRDSDDGHPGRRGTRPHPLRRQIALLDRGHEPAASCLRARPRDVRGR
jgi:hypothetical protein